MGFMWWFLLVMIFLNILSDLILLIFMMMWLFGNIVFGVVVFILIYVVLGLVIVIVGLVVYVIFDIGFGVI